MIRRLAIAALALTLVAGCSDDLADASRRLEHADSPAERAGAARRLGEIGGPEAMALLARYGLRDKSAQVRLAAVKGLEDKHDRHLVDLFDDLLTDPDADVQAAAAGALAEQGGKKAESYLALAYERVDGPARDAIASALEKHAGSPSKALSEIAARRLAKNLSALHSGSQGERIGAAEQLGRSGRPKAVAALLPLLADRSIPVAAAAARGLGDAGDTRAVPPLLQVLSEPYPELERAAAHALGALGDARAVGPLTKAALDGGPSVAIEIVTDLERLTGHGAVDAKAALCKVALGSATPDVAGEAAEAALAVGADCQAAGPVAKALGKGGADALPALAVVGALGKKALDAAGEKKLLALVDNADPEVQAAAWRAAAAAGETALGARAVKALVDLEAVDRKGRAEWVSTPLPTRPGFGASQAAVDADGGTPGDDTLGSLGLSDRKRYDKRYRKLMDDLAAYRAKIAAKHRAALGQPAVDPETAKKHALDALVGDAALSRVELVDDLPPHIDVQLAGLAVAAGRLGGASALPALARLTGHPSTAVRVAAVEGLSGIGTDAATSAIEKALAPGQPGEVISAAAKALGRRKAGVAALVKAARFAPPEALPDVASALGRAGGADAVKTLTALLDGSAAGAAARALGTLGGPSAIAALCTHLMGTALAGRLEAVQALGRMGQKDPKVAAALRRGLHSRRAEVRAAAAHALERLGIDDPWLGALGSDYDRRVRLAATGGQTKAGG